ncbi:hypothetical protein FRB94_005101 [Tulasnella sp. JGI-2019a]|nr:hypothetical protein FRB94_005101 [Tulasnella sp. JGI-2019a]KAG9032550.1 hypothetical protein FRB95_001215 [Tulasnella sp. JGI-2019a]
MKCIVETRLYTDIFIRSNIRMAKLFRTLHTRPDLARNIITFEGTLFPAPPKYRSPSVTPLSFIKNWNKRRSIRKQERVICETTVASIHHMVNVQILTLSDFGWLGTPYQNLVRDAISSTASLSSLTILTIEGKAFDISSRHEGYSLELSLLLGSLPLLECLQLPSGDWDLEGCILQSDVPYLGRLLARSQEARLLVPGRSITSLAIVQLFEVPDPDEWRFLAASAVPITFFALNDTRSPKVLKSVLRSVAKHFKDVQRLILHGSIYDMLPLLVEGLPSFSSLRTLCIMAWDIDTEGKKRIEGQRLHAITCIRSVNPQFENLEIERW